MDKRLIIGKILARLDEEQNACLEAAKAAQAAATDPQNKAENKYDTRGLEASYLARGQALQIAEIDFARQQYGAFTPRDFAAGEPVGLGALVTVEERAGRETYFYGPAAGGAEVDVNGAEVIVVTAKSPLAQALLGRRVGDTLPGGRRIVAVA